MNAAEIARNLHGRKLPSGWVARCPAHDDHDPSLSLKDADDGRILVKCHAGCPQTAVIDALKAKGLWPEHERRQGGVIVATYDYRDDAGQLLYQVVRTEPKGFFQRRPDGFDGWINRKGRYQVLYRLREVLEAPIVFCVEGERDVETLRSYGFVPGPSVRVPQEIRKAMARGGRYGSRGLLPSVTGVRLEGRRPGAIRYRYVVISFGRIGRCFWAERPTRRFGGFAIRRNRFKGSQVVLDERIGLLASVDVVAQENRQTLADLPLLIAELAESIFVGGNQHGGFNILKPRLS